MDKNDDDFPMNIVEFHYLLTVRVGNPAHTLKIKISRGKDIYTAIVLEHVNNKGITVKDISSPNILHASPTRALNVLVKTYLDDYNPVPPPKPTLTLVK